MPTPLTDDTETLRFRGSTIEAALDAAEKSLGGRVRLVAANRLRRGGIGGFFASDMGVEVSVAPEDETIEDALQRLVEGTGAEEREEWRRQVAASAALAGGAPQSVAARQPEPDSGSDSAREGARQGAPELEPEFIHFPPPVVAPIAAAALPPARPAVEVVATPQMELVADVHALAIQAASGNPAMAQVKPSPAMLRRHVELAVAAADQMIGSLNNSPRVKSITARVVVRSGNQYEVETEARWEAHEGVHS